jgi:hypothetical protein
VGVGTAPEGIEQNPVVFDLVNELSFRWVVAPANLVGLWCSGRLCLWPCACSIVVLLSHHQGAKGCSSVVLLDSLLVGTWAPWRGRVATASCILHLLELLPPWPFVSDLALHSPTGHCPGGLLERSSPVCTGAPSMAGQGMGHAFEHAPCTHF